MLRCISILITFLIGISGFLMSQTANWTGGGDGTSWEDDNNWDIGFKPTITYDVLINNGNVNISTVQNIKSLVLENSVLEVDIDSRLGVISASSVGAWMKSSQLLVKGNMIVQNSGSTPFVVDTSSEVGVESGASILIEDSPGSTGIYNQGNITISGTISVENVSIGINNQDSVNIEGRINISNTSNRGIDNSGKLLILIDGILDIGQNDGLSFGAIQNFDSIDTAGEILIANSKAGGIYNRDSTTCLNNSGVINISKINNKIALSNFGDVVNTGDMWFRELNGNGILNSGNSARFMNYDSIRIDSVRSYGIKNEDESKFYQNMNAYCRIRNGITDNCIAIINQSDFTNSSKIMILDTFLYAINSTGCMINEDSICFTAINGGIINSGYFENQFNGHISGLDYGVNNMGGASFAGINNIDSFINEGSISFGGFPNYGIINGENAVFNNGGVVKLFEGENFAIDNHGIFDNLPGSFIEIAHLDLGPGAMEAAGISTSNYFKNQSLIYISDIEGIALDASGKLFNSDSIIIDSVETRAILNSGHMVNEADGYIKINNSSGFGLMNGDTLVNQGEIAIANTDKTGLYTNGYLKNEETIEIQNTLEDGLANDEFGYFENSGMANLTITNINGSNKSGILNYSILVNHGYIHLSNCTDYGIYSAGSATTLNNDSLIELSAAEKGIFLSQNSKLENQANGTIQISNIYQWPLEVELGSELNCLGVLDVQN